MCRNRPVPFAGSVTTKASRCPSGENSKSPTFRKFTAASTVSVFPPSLSCPKAAAELPALTSKATPANRKYFANMKTLLFSKPNQLGEYSTTPPCSSGPLFGPEAFPRRLQDHSPGKRTPTTLNEVPASATLRQVVCFPSTLSYNHRFFRSEKCRKLTKSASTTRSPIKPS